MTKRRLVFETQKKRFYEGPEPSSLVENLRDSLDHETMLNGRISEYLMQGLTHIGIPCHFIRRLNMRETLIQRTEIFPFSILIRNRADEEYANALDFELGSILPEPVIEFEYHNSKGDSRKLARNELSKFELANEDEIDIISSYSHRVNDYLSGVYWSIGYFLIDLKLEFGHQTHEDFSSTILVADDIGPLQSQIWDVTSDDEENIQRASLDDVANRLGFQ